MDSQGSVVSESQATKKIHDQHDLSMISTGYEDVGRQICKVDLPGASGEQVGGRALSRGVTSWSDGIGKYKACFHENPEKPLHEGAR